MKLVADTKYRVSDYQLSEVEKIAKKVMDLREAGALSGNALKKISKFFKIKNIFHSNAIEGNTLDMGETRVVVEKGLTLAGRPLKDQLEAKNLSHALDYLEELATSKIPAISAREIRELHTLVLRDVDSDNAGRYRTKLVEISGSKHKPARPEALPGQMDEFSKWLEKASRAESGIIDAEAIVCAAIAHTWFVSIHPFIDGNGRVARLILNLMLMRSGFPVAIITQEDKFRYYEALEISHSGDLSPFVSLLTETLNESLEIWQEAAKQQTLEKEWAAKAGAKFGKAESEKLSIEFEMQKNAFELFRTGVRETVRALNNATPTGGVSVKDFGAINSDQFKLLKSRESVKRAWFLRMDFHQPGKKTARYLYFFGFSSATMTKYAPVSVHIARENPPGSFHYERLDRLGDPNVPSIIEIAFSPKDEKFIYRTLQNRVVPAKSEEIVRLFIDDVIKKHFSS